MGRDAEERGEKRREKRVEMKHHSVSAVEHWTASEARQNREIAIRKDERMKVLDELKAKIDNSKNYASNDRMELFHYTGLHCMIDELREAEP